MNVFRQVSLALVFVMTMSILSIAAEPKRPKIGLALSGGGALGIAHVGVLQVLEELQIPIDFVAGTSMGAIVGGLYASGLSTRELEHALESADWRSVFDDRPPRRELPYRRKVDDLNFLTRFEIGFNDWQFELPPALVSGQKFNFMLQALTMPAAGISDFSELPIPFRAVATDVETGEMVILSQGDLGRALRASMAVPGLFTPIEINGRLLVDGGMVRNLPVDVVRAMGADVVIAVDARTPLRTRDQLESLSNMTGHAVSLMIEANVAPQAADADVLIRPNMKGFNSVDFERWAEMIPRGVAAARDAADDLKGYSVDARHYDAFQRTHSRKRGEPPDRVANIVVTTGSRADPDLVLSQVRTRPGDVFDLELIRNDLQRLYELGDYESVGFYLTREPNGWLINIQANEKSWGPNIMRFGLNLVSDLEGEGSYGVLANYTLTALNRLRGEAKIAVEIGESPAVNGEWYQPLSLSNGWFVSLNGGRSNTVFEVADSPDYPTGSYRVEGSGIGFDLGYGLGRWGELRVGADRGFAMVEPRLVAEPIDDLEFNLGGWRFQAIIDQLDNPNFAHEGFLIEIEGVAGRERLGSDTDFDKLSAFALGAHTFGHHTIIGTASWGTAFDNDLPIYERFSMGGLFNLSGTPPGRVSGQAALQASAIYAYRLGNLMPAIGGGYYLGCSTEAGNAWESRSQVELDDLITAGSLFFGADTIIGPVYLGWGRNSRGESSTYLFLGRSF